MNLREVQLYAPEKPAGFNTRLSALSEAITLALRSAGRVAAPFQKLNLVLDDPPTSTNDWVILPSGIGELVIGSRVLDDEMSDSELRDRVDSLLNAAIERLVPPSETRDGALSAIGRVLRIGPPYEFELFRLKAPGRRDQRPRVVYRFSDTDARIDVDGPGPNDRTTVVQTKSFLPGNFLLSATKGFLKDGQAVLMDRSGTVVASLAVPSANT